MSGNVEYLYIGNENKPLSELNGYESGSFTIGSDIPGDPAYGCAKNFVLFLKFLNKIFKKQVLFWCKNIKPDLQVLKLHR